MQDRKAKAIGSAAGRRKLRAEFTTPKAGDRTTGNKEFGSQATGTPESQGNKFDPRKTRRAFGSGNRSLSFTA